MKIKSVSQYGILKKLNTIPNEFVYTGTLPEGSKLVMACDGESEDEIYLTEETEIWKIPNDKQYSGITSENHTILKDGEHILYIGGEPAEYGDGSWLDKDERDEFESEFDSKYLNNNWIIIYHM